MKFRFWIIYGVLIWMGIMPAQAAPDALYSTQYLQHLCNSTYDVDAGLCAGYIMGVADTLQQQKQACLSPNISPEVLVENIRRAWEQKKDQPDNALHSIQDIFLTRFPCR
jgi:hypothetical protein